MRWRSRTSLPVLLAAVLALTLVAWGDTPTGGQPTDYVAQADAGVLSQPIYEQTVRTSEYVTMAHDGTDIYVEVVRPDPETYGDLNLPVIMEISPYHGTLHPDRAGKRIFPDDPGGLTGYFAPRGYVVVMVDLRGTGRSRGCLDHLGPNDAEDMKEIVEWAAHPDRSWNGGVWGKVGLTGHSYVGSTPSVAAAQNPRGLATIVPSAGLASMYDHQFQMGVPYYLQWAGPQWAYPGISTVRDLPPVGTVPQFGNTGDNWGNSEPTEIGCGWKNSAFTAGHGQVTGQYQDWHAQRDWREQATDIDVPVFIIHGVNDNAARIPAAEWFFGNRFDRPGDKVWIGQWDHGSGAHVNRRYDQWKYALHAWFDEHLKGMDVDTGPAVEAFLGASNQGPVYTADAWDEPTDFVTLYPDASDMSLGTAPPETDASVSFQGLAGFTSAGKVTFTSEPFELDTVLLGLPHLQLNAAVTGQSMYVVTALNRIDAFGRSVPMNFCAINPHLREGVDTPAPVVPTQEMELEPQCFTMAHFVPAGQQVQFVVNTTSAHHAPFLAFDAQITVHTGPDKTAYDLPVVRDATIYPDGLPLQEDG